MAILRRNLNVIRSLLVYLLFTAAVCDVRAQAKTPAKQVVRERADEVITCEFTVFAPRAVAGLGRRMARSQPVRSPLRNPRS